MGAVPLEPWVSSIGGQEKDKWKHRQHEGTVEGVGQGCFFTPGITFQVQLAFVTYNK